MGSTISATVAGTGQEQGAPGTVESRDEDVAPPPRLQSITATRSQRNRRNSQWELVDLSSHAATIETLGYIKVIQS